MERDTRTDTNLADAPDLDAEPEPRPTTFAERRTIAAVGALAILIACGTLVRVLGSGATPTSAAGELAASAHARPAHPAARPGPPAPVLLATPAVAPSDAPRASSKVTPPGEPLKRRTSLADHPE
jgi:hypothetical protein